MTAKILISIDAGFVTTGLTAYLVNTKRGIKLISAQIIETKKHKNKAAIRVSDDDVERLKFWTNGMNDFISDVKKIIKRTYIKRGYEADDIKFKLFASIEFPSGGAKGARALRCMSMITGALVPFLVLKDIPFEAVTPTQVKSIVKNKKSVTKEDVIKSVIIYLRDNKICTVILTKKSERKKYISLHSSITDYTDSITLSLFEHVADSVSAMKYVVENSQLYKLFVGVKNG